MIGKTIFLVVSGTEKLKTPIHASFDSIKRAKSFLNRFKTQNDAKIVTCYVDQKFQTQEADNCYLIHLNRRHDIVEGYLINDVNSAFPLLKYEHFMIGDCISICGIAISEKDTAERKRRLKIKTLQQGNDTVLTKRKKKRYI